MSECFIKNYQKDGAIIYHDGKCDNDSEANCGLEAEDLSYRYSGGNDVVHNYICLDNKTTGSCETNDDLYRIIGLFKNDQNEINKKYFFGKYAMA